MLVSNGSLVTKSVPLEFVAARWTTLAGVDPFQWAAYDAIYRSHLWVAVVVNKRAGMVSRLPLKVYRRGTQGRVDARDHAFARLLRNPYPGLSPNTLWSWTCSTFDIYGEAFWVKGRERFNIVNQLIPAHPTNMVREDDGSWTYRQAGRDDQPLARRDVIHFKSYNPTNMHRGMSRLEPLRLTLENEWNARTATASFWKRGARPGLALTHPQTLTKDAQERLKAQFDGAAAGSGNTGATIVLEEGMKPEKLTLTAEEAQYIETRKLNREEVLAVFDMPPPAVHVLDHATFSNITEQFRSVYRDTLGPVLRHFESVIETDLREPDFGDEVYAEFLMDEVLRGDFEARQTAYRMADYMTPAEKRELENLPFIDGTDRVIINAASIPLDQLDEVTQARTAGQPSRPQILPAATVRSIMGRLSRPDSLAGVDVADLGPDAAALLDAAKAAGEDLAGFKSRLRALVRE